MNQRWLVSKVTNLQFDKERSYQKQEMGMGSVSSRLERGEMELSWSMLDV